MSKDDIDLIVSCSEQTDRLIAGHQQEMQQVLANNRRLRSVVNQQQSLLDDKERQINKLALTVHEQAQAIDQLKAELAQLRQRPLNNFNDCNIGELVEKKISYDNHIQPLPYSGTGA